MRATVLLLLYFPLSLNAQPAGERDSLVRRLAARNYVTGSRIVTGLYSGPLQYDEQYGDYERLLPWVDETDLPWLFGHDSLAVAAFAFKAAVARFPRQVVPLLQLEFSRPRTRTFRHFLNTCQGDVRTTLLAFMLTETWVKLKHEKLVLTRAERKVYKQIYASVFGAPPVWRLKRSRGRF